MDPKHAGGSVYRRAFRCSFRSPRCLVMRGAPRVCYTCVSAFPGISVDKVLLCVDLTPARFHCAAPMSMALCMLRPHHVRVSCVGAIPGTSRIAIASGKFLRPGGCTEVAWVICASGGDWWMRVCWCGFFEFMFRWVSDLCCLNVSCLMGAWLLCIS